MIEAEEALSKAHIEAANTVSALRVEAASKGKDMAAMYDAQLTEMRKETDVRRKDEVHAVETAMTAQIQVLLLYWSAGSRDYNSAVVHFY